VQRSFPTLHERTEANSLLRKLVLFDFSETRWSEQAQLPLHVGVHMIKISVPQDSELGLSSPDVLHQDGEPYTFAHLIYRRNAVAASTASPCQRRPERAPSSLRATPSWPVSNTAASPRNVGRGRELLECRCRA
jgi:hypothetical protein